MEAIITAVKNRITALNPAFKYVDEDWGQLDYYSPQFPVKWPCLLVDVQTVQWQNEGNLMQKGLATVSIKIAHLRLSNSSAKAPQQQQQNNNSFFALTQGVFKSLHGFTANNEVFTALIRVSERRVQRDDGVKVYEMVFTTQVADATAVVTPGLVPRPSVKFVTV